MQVRVTRWGKGLGVRIPEELAARLGLCEDSRVELTAEAGRLRLSLVSPPCLALRVRGEEAFDDREPPAEFGFQARG